MAIIVDDHDYDPNAVYSEWYHTYLGGYVTAGSGGMSMKRDYSVSNEPEHRTKPGKPLWKSMTNQSRQYRFSTVTGTGVTQHHSWSRCYTHPGCYMSSRKRLYSYQVQQCHENDLPITEDWATKIRLEIADETINLGTTLAEYRQSVNMFGNAARGIVDAWRLFKGKGRRRKKLTMCSVAASELVYSYGVAPLLSDTFDVVEALRLRLEHPVFRRYYTSCKATKYGKTEGTPLSSGYTGRWSAKKSQRVNAYVEFDMQKAALVNYGWQNPASLIWEVIPYSFVVDWMIPVGDYLASLDALRAVSTAKVSVTEKFKYGHAYRKYYKVAGIPYQSKNGTRNYESHERYIYNSIPLPALPRWDPSSSYKALLNAVSLLVQTRGCKGKMPRVAR